MASLSCILIFTPYFFITCKHKNIFNSFIFKFFYSTPEFFGVLNDLALEYLSERKRGKGTSLANMSERQAKIVDEVALLQALENREIAGYAGDVLADEFRFDDTGLVHHPLVDYAKNHQNAIIVPHTGGMTVESRENTDIFTTEKLKKYLSADRNAEHGH